MPLFNIAIRKAINTNGIAYKWSNRYFVEEPDVTAALSLASNIWTNIEATFHLDLAFCYEVYANNTEDAPFTPGTTQGIPIGVQRGLIEAGPDNTPDLLPPWNVVRVDFPVVASRPSRKFYRIPLIEQQITSGQLNAQYITIMQPALNLFTTVGTMRDIDGQAYAGDPIIRGLTSRRLGREAGLSVPPGPAFG